MLHYHMVLLRTTKQLPLDEFSFVVLEVAKQVNRTIGVVNLAPPVGMVDLALPVGGSGPNSGCGKSSLTSWNGGSGLTSWWFWPHQLVW